MKTTLLSMAAAAALSIASVAFAGPQVATETSSESVKINAPRYHLEPYQYEDFEHAYRMSNGDTMRFTRNVGRFYTEVKGSPRVEIFSVGPSSFVTRAGASLSFADEGYELTVDHYERIAITGNLPENTIVMARR